MLRVGVYAGAFDPIHDGHVDFARQAAKDAGLDKVYFLVEPRPRHKQGVKAFEHRLRMVELAIAPYPSLGLIILEQARFSVHDTWPRIQARFAGAHVSMLMGEDVFMRLSHWPRIDELVHEVDFVVGLRRHKLNDLKHHLQTIEKTKHLKLHYRTFISAHPGYSSTKIRAALRAGAYREGLHPDVLDYIKGQGLYGFSPK